MADVTFSGQAKVNLSADEMRDLAAKIAAEVEA
jgi:hypothetical protein